MVLRGESTSKLEEFEQDQDVLFLVHFDEPGKELVQHDQPLIDHLLAHLVEVVLFREFRHLDSREVGLQGLAEAAKL